MLQMIARQLVLFDQRKQIIYNFRMRKKNKFYFLFIESESLLIIILKSTNVDAKKTLKVKHKNITRCMKASSELKAMRCTNAFDNKRNKAVTNCREASTNTL